jgi:preprotein translocase SecE subunit
MKKQSEKLEPQLATSIAVPNIKKRGWKGFYRDLVRDLKHVNWPSRHETTRLSMVVFAVCLITIAILFGLSVVFDELYRLLLK